jgi:hypothetical protein
MILTSGTATIPKPGPGRPVTDPDALERQTLTRIATLSHEILHCLREPGRGRYDSSGP